MKQEKHGCEAGSYKQERQNSKGSGCIITCESFTPQGTITAPPSKSIAQRALILASLAQTPSRLFNIGSSADVIACMHVLTQMGTSFYQNKTYEGNTDRQAEKTSTTSTAQKNSKTHDLLQLPPSKYECITVLPLDLTIIKNISHINCKESATLARMLAGILPGIWAKLKDSTDHKSYGTTFTKDRAPGTMTIQGTGTLLTRLMHKTAQFLKALHIDVSLKDNKYLPMKITGLYKPGSFSYGCIDTSQPVSGAIIGLSLLNGDSELIIKSQPSLPYTMLTADIANLFGLQIMPDINAHDTACTWHVKGCRTFTGIDLAIEGDWSSAALFFAGAALNGSITVTGLDPASLQPDRIILEVLSAYGAEYTVTPSPALQHATDIQRKTDGKAFYSITVNSGKRKPISVDVKNTPDIFPAVCLLAAASEGKSRIFGIENLSGKESDRVAVIQKILENIGVQTVTHKTVLEITGKPVFHGAELTLPPDHRMVMFALLLACRLAPGEKLTITLEHDADIDSVLSKSYPGFLADYTHIGGLVS